MSGGVVGAYTCTWVVLGTVLGVGSSEKSATIATTADKRYKPQRVDRDTDERRGNTNRLGEAIPKSRSSDE